MFALPTYTDFQHHAPGVAHRSRHQRVGQNPSENQDGPNWAAYQAHAAAAAHTSTGAVIIFVVVDTGLYLSLGAERPALHLIQFDRSWGSRLQI